MDAEVGIKNSIAAEAMRHVHSPVGEACRRYRRCDFVHRAREEFPKASFTLQKILNAMDTDLAAFFAEDKKREASPIFLREHMQAVSDGDRTYTIVFGKQPNVHVEMFDEDDSPPPSVGRRSSRSGATWPDICCLVIWCWKSRASRRGHCVPATPFISPKNKNTADMPQKDEPVRLITIYHPARY